MTLKEQCFDLIEHLPEEQLEYYVAFLRDISRLYGDALQEALDDAFCVLLAKRHESDPDRDELPAPIEELAEKWAIGLNED